MLQNTAIGHFIKSLKFRFIILICFVSFIPGIILTSGVLSSYAARAISIRQSEVLSQAQILANQIATSEYLTNKGVGERALQAQIDMLTNIYDGRVMVINPDFKIISDTYNLSNGQTIISREVMISFKGELYTHYDKEYNYIEMTIPITNPEEKSPEIKGVLLVSVSTDNVRLNRIYLGRMGTLWGAVVMPITFFLSILAILLLLKPIGKLAKESASMRGGYGNLTLNVNEYSETAEICEHINAVIRRMTAMDESRQEFVSNVSHELKTPMTSIKVLADTINSMPDAPLEMYQEFMVDITAEIDRENKIITDLLALVRMDKSAADLNIENININELLGQIMKRLQPIGDRQKVSLVLESFRPVYAEVDEVKLTLALSNLIENAIKYNQTDGSGWVHVSLNSDHQYFYVKVEDNGIGIPEESLAHIYERFYRADKSHSREIGGTGLGLAITQNAIRVHKGNIMAHSKLGEGTTFDVRIPLNYIAS